MDAKLERNKQIVADFYDLIINKKDYEAAKKYMGPRYKQHNPLVKDYPEGLKEFIEFLKTNAPQAHSEIKDAMQQNMYLQREITAARELYNDTVNTWNKDIYIWPTKMIVAAKEGYTTRIPFIASQEIKQKAKGVFF